MAEFILKDWYGKEKAFDHETIYVRDKDGNLMPFTQGDGKPPLESLAVTENGDYTPSEGYYGFDHVNVNVASSGGSSLPAGVYWKVGSMAFPNKYYQRWFTLNGTLYASTLTANGSAGSNTVSVYKWNGASWSLVTTTSSLGAYLNIASMSYVEFGGKIHIMGDGTNYHFTFDGATVAKLNNFPQLAYNGMLFTQGGSLKHYSEKDGNVYVWNASNDSWSVEATIGSKYQYYYFVNVGSDAYAERSKTLYKYENGTMTAVGTTALSAYSLVCAIGSKIYYGAISSAGGAFYSFNVATGENVELGKTPPSKTGFNLTYFNNELHLVGCDNTYQADYIMHEVTE